MITQLQRAHRETKTENLTILKNILSFKALALTFSAICRGKLLVGMNYIAIKFFPTISLTKN